MARQLVEAIDAAHQKALDTHRSYRARNREKRRTWNRVWMATNRARYDTSRWAYRERVKAEVIRHYSHGSMACAHCGFTNIDALCLDHIHDDGAQQRRLLGISGRTTCGAGTHIYEGLKRAGWPEGLQVLCANCNLIKEVQRKRRQRGTQQRDGEDPSQVLATVVSAPAV